MRTDSCSWRQWHRRRLMRLRCAVEAASRSAMGRQFGSVARGKNYKKLDILETNTFACGRTPLRAMLLSFHFFVLEGALLFRLCFQCFTVAPLLRTVENWQRTAAQREPLLCCTALAICAISLAPPSSASPSALNCPSVAIRPRSDSSCFSCLERCALTRSTSKSVPS